jgi:phospholipid/cholesterol/gamma-HCH transport system substrate-binding protein
MTRRGLEIRVGFVVVLAAIIVVLGVMWFQKFELVESRYEFFARFNDVGGLKSADQVYVDGVVRGRVESVELGDMGVVVRLGIRVGVEFPVDSRLKIQSAGMMGERFLAVTRGTSPQAIAPGDTVDGELMMGLSELMSGAGEVLGDVAKTSRDLRDILEALSRDGKLQSSIDDLSAASSNLRSITDENQPKLANAIAGFERVSTRMDSLIARHYSSLDSSLAGIGRAGQNIDEAVQNLSSAAKDLKEITRRLNEGEGTLGKLLSDDELIDRLNSTVSKLDSLITDIKLHPGRYVKLELF